MNPHTSRRKKKKKTWTKEATLELKVLVEEYTLDELAIKLKCTVSRLLQKCRAHVFPYTRSKKGQVMRAYYKTKADFHHKQWEAAVDGGKEKAAAHHMTEYINYAELLKIAERNGIA